jgi:hypothetical protein
MPLRGRVRRLEKQAARLEAQRLQAHRFAIRTMTLEQRKRPVARRVAKLGGCAPQN